MKHSQIQKQLSAYLDEELSPQVHEKVDSHLRTCNECAEILLDLRQNRQWLVNLRQPAPSGLWEAVSEQMENPNRRQVKRKFQPDFSDIWRRWIFRPASAGVAALATVCLVLGLVYLNPTPDASDDSLDFYLMVHTDYATHSPLTTAAATDSFATVEESGAEGTDTAFSDQTTLDTYLAAYFGE